jgi:two-component system, OmpR family, aerobic respiration control sensor histidine kinase ArcB
MSMPASGHRPGMLGNRSHEPNAVKFTLDGGSIAVRLLAPVDGSGAVIEVEDTAIGIPEADQEMFCSAGSSARPRPARRRCPGSGLGLSIAKSIADLHGAGSATSVFGSGSTFRVEFPLPHPVEEPQR